jgi:hypothetical protein
MPAREYWALGWRHAWHRYRSLSIAQSFMAQEAGTTTKTSICAPIAQFERLAQDFGM